jgi:surface antigen
LQAPGAATAFIVLFGIAAASASADARTDHRRDARAAAGTAAAAQQAAAPRSAAAAQGDDDARTGGANRGGISCVPYARQATGIAIRGNGREWWHKAAGLYARSDRPEVGSVLSFPASGGMRLGHVAAVSRVLGAREILIDHANWAGPGIRRGTVMRGVSVVDVSPDNDWTAVRVQVGWNRGTYGRVYPTHGFILNRPDPAGDGTMLADRGGARGPAAIRTAAAAGSGRASGGRASRQGAGGAGARWEEMAEAPRETASPHVNQHLDLSIRALDGDR